MNVRCANVAIGSLVLHPDFREIPWVRESAMEMISRAAAKSLDFTLACDLPADWSRPFVKRSLDMLRKKQRPSGVWGGRDWPRLSYFVLKALKGCGLLGQLLEDCFFRRDPLAPFRTGDGWHAFLVRRNLECKPGDSDSHLKERFQSDLFAGQNEEGSWNGTVLSTANHLESLAEMGVTRDDARVRRGIDWLLGTCSERVARHSGNLGGYVVGHHMFSSGNRGSDLLAALAEKPEWNPKAVCYSHLPNMQNGAAIRALLRHGLAKDARVMMACRNLVEIHETYGGWCDTNIRTGLLAKKKAGEELPPKTDGL